MHTCRLQYDGMPNQEGTAGVSQQLSRPVHSCYSDDDSDADTPITRTANEATLAPVSNIASTYSPLPGMTSCSIVKPKIGQKIEECPSGAAKFRGTIHSRAGKTTGKNSKCFNVKVNNGEVQ